MAQIVKVVDITKTFVPVDPRTFPKNLHYTAGQDAPDRVLPILAYEGYNFLPTAYGYRSYFGTNSILDISALGSRCDKVLLYQFGNLQNILIALCEDGLWISLPSSSGNTWTQYKALAVPTPGEYKKWTYFILANKIYIYRQGNDRIYWIGPTDISANVVTVNDIIPTADGVSLMTADIEGIFRANGRIGMWNTSNGVFWGSFFQPEDFTPKAETQAGLATFRGVTGKITTILPQADGFVIYCTKSIVGVRASIDRNVLWDASTITDNAGVLYPFQVSTGLTEVEHYAYTNTGIKKIGSFNALNRSHGYEEILTDFYDMIKELRTPVRLDVMNGRFLFFSVIDPTYIDAATSLVLANSDAFPVRVLMDGGLEYDSSYSLPAQFTSGSAEAVIGSYLHSGVLYGGFSRWDATMAAFFTEVISPASAPYYRKTAAYPYVILDDGTHVPNLPVETTSSWVYTAPVGSFPDASALNSLHGVDPALEEVVSYATGGWNIHPNSFTDGREKQDSFVLEMIATQQLEWQNAGSIMAANHSAITSIPSYTGDIVYGVTAYANADGPVLDDLEAQIADYVASNSATRVGNTAYYDVEIGTMFSGDGTLGTLSHTGSTISQTYTYSGGYTVKKRHTRSWEIRAVVNYAVAKDLRLKRLSANYPPPATDLYYKAFSVGESRAYSYAVINSYLPYVGGFYEGTFTAVVGDTLNATTFAGDIYMACTNYSYLLTHSVLSSGTSLSTGYFIDYVDSESIISEINPSLSFVSEFTATQLYTIWATDITQEFVDSINGYDFVFETGAYSIPAASVSPTGNNGVGFTYPPATFLVSDGSVAPIYPDYAGAFVLDLMLQKWGKVKATYRCLLDYQPVNEASEPVTYTNFGMDTGVLTVNGSISKFDTTPTASRLRYGKIGYDRKGFMQMQEVRLGLRNTPTAACTLQLDSSYDGRNLELSSHAEITCTASSNTLYATQSGRWHTITLEGNFDLQYLEIRANLSGRR